MQVGGRTLFPGAAMFELSTAASAMLLQIHPSAVQAASTDIALPSALELPAPNGLAPRTAVILTCRINQRTGSLQLASTNQDMPRGHSHRQHLHMSASYSRMAPHSVPDGTTLSLDAEMQHTRRALQLSTPVLECPSAFVASIASGISGGAADSGNTNDGRSAAQVDSGLQLGAVAPALRGSSPASLAVPVGAAAYCGGDMQLEFAVAAARIPFGKSPGADLNPITMACSAPDLLERGEGMQAREF